MPPPGALLQRRVRQCGRESRRGGDEADGAGCGAERVRGLLGGFGNAGGGVGASEARSGSAVDCRVRELRARIVALRDNRTTAPSKIRVNTRLFSSGPMSPKGRGRRDILACLRARLVALRLGAATVRERMVVT